MSQDLRVEAVVSVDISNCVCVDRGALTMALNVLRRSGKEEVADALEQATIPLPPSIAP